MRPLRSRLAALALLLASGSALAADDPAAVAMAAARRGDVEAALQASEAAVASRPTVAYAWDVRAYALSLAGRKDEAAQAYEKASKLDPRDVLARMNRCSVLLALGRPAEALTSIDEALKIDPTSARAQNHRGVALERLGRLDEARSAYRAAIRMAPRDAVAHNNLGALAYRRGVEGAASALFSKAVELDPTFDAAALNASMTVALAGSGNAGAAAEEAILQAAASPHASPEAKARGKGVLADRAAREGRTAPARALYQEQAALDPTDPTPLNNLGVLEDQLGLARESLLHFQAALELRPEDANIQNNVGVVHVHRGDLAAAENTFREVLRGDPRFHRAWHNLGVVLGAKGDRVGAADAFRRAASLAPADASTIYNLAILDREANGDRALERAAYERALALDPNLVEAHLSLGMLLADPTTPAALRDPTQARVHLRRFLDLAFADDAAGRKQASDWLAWLASSPGPGAPTAPAPTR